MDKLFSLFKRLPSRLDVDVEASYVSGDCNVCFQRGVKIKPLDCDEHNVCRMCVNFVPKLVNGDFSCTICKRKTHGHGSFNQTSMDRFFSAHTGVKTNFDDVIVNVDGKIISGEDTNDNDDLCGYNDQWDHLLLSDNTQSTSGIKSQSDVTGHPNSPTRLAKTPRIPKKTSILRLGLPSSKKTRRRGGQGKAKLDTQVCPCSDSEDSDSDEFTVLGHKDASSDNKPHRSSRGPFMLDPTEQERGSSPCKAPPHYNSRPFSGTISDTLASSRSETERFEEIGTIDGPSFSDEEPTESGEPNDTRLLLFDEHFWDCKI